MKFVLLILGLVALIAAFFAIGGAIFAVGFNLFGSAFDWPVIAWYHGVGAVIAFSVLGIGSTGIRARSGD
jgi:uncharacterized integral membrane protein